MKQKSAQAEHERRLALYNQGKSDKQIAAILGWGKSTITSWRSVHKLPCVSTIQYINKRGVKIGYKLSKATICWECKNAYADLCVWFEYAPDKERLKEYIKKNWIIDGEKKYTPTVIKGQLMKNIGGRIDDTRSFIVHGCKRFEHDGGKVRGCIDFE